MQWKKIIYILYNAYRKNKTNYGETSYFDLADPAKHSQISCYEKLNYPMFQEKDWCGIPWEAVSVQFEKRCHTYAFLWCSFATKQ